MTTSADAFALAIDHFQAGRLAEAQAVCERILTADPNHAATWHLQGVLKFQLGQNDLAEQSIQRSLQLFPNDPLAHNSLGRVLAAQKKWTGAEASFRRAAKLAPHDCEIHGNLGIVLRCQDKYADAISCFRRALQLNPALDDVKTDLISVLFDLGAEFQSRGNVHKAIENYRQALEIDQDLAYVHFDLGKAYASLNAHRDAIDCYERVLKLAPDSYEALLNLGVSFRCLGNISESIAFGQRALKLRPHSAEVYNNLGLAAFDLGDFAPAIEYFRQALRHDPQLAEAHFNLAHALQSQGLRDQAFESYQQALSLNCDFADAHAGLATLRLLKGDFANGWPEYEWRFKVDSLLTSWASRESNLPRWDGSSLSGKTILIQAEQGLGDTIQFIRYASVLRAMNAVTVVECQKSLLPLLATCRGIDQLIAQREPLPSCDFRIPLLSIPGILQTTLESIPADVPYLFANEAIGAEWQSALRDIPGLRIGINWRSKPGPRNSWQRNLPLECFEPLAQILHVQLVNLQHGLGGQELKQARDRLYLHCPGADIDQQHGAFMDTAAILMNLDLVITSDTSLAHLAGALGIPVWVALPLNCDWRWLLHRTDSPWYPTMRLFRQQTPDDWKPVFREIHTALTELSVSRQVAK